jgi:cell division protein ZapA (FtsZ GTPase activity inhibitor)
VSKPKPQPIEVEIYDQRYAIVLKEPLDESDVRSLADEVDTRMREISELASTADSLRVAVLTALHLAQEIRELKKQYEDSDVLIQTKTNEWARTLEAVLKK